MRTATSAAKRLALFVALVSCCLVVVPTLASTAAPPASNSPCLVAAELDGVVNAGTARYLSRALSEATSRRCAAILVRVDTPGGTLDATREIVGEFLRSEVPIIAYVAPQGARAGSAGMFIVLSAHVAAMAPGTNIGAAHPVLLGGGNAEQADPEMKNKIVNDTAAFARAIAERRSRNLAWAESAVRESKSATATEALDQDVIDVVAATRAELLERIDEHDATAPKLSLSNAVIQHLPQTIQERVLAALGNPSLAYLLLLAGLFALTLELYAPGTFVFGGVGVVLLLLAAIGFGMLPVNAGGVLFIVLAVALFAAEIFVTSHGLLALGGVGALLVGSALLYDRTDADFFADASVRLSWALVIPLAATMATAALWIAYHAARSQHRTPVTGREALHGATGVALTPIDERGGSVRVHGERWHAVSAVPVAEGEAIVVEGSAGLVLRVARRPNGNSKQATKEVTP